MLVFIYVFLHEVVGLFEHSKRFRTKRTYGYALDYISVVNQKKNRQRELNRQRMNEFVRCCECDLHTEREQERERELMRKREVEKMRECNRFDVHKE